jgi:tRNA dimethylallyltransferase
MADAAVRAGLEADARASGWDKMHERLAMVDPVAASRIHRNDPQRIQRALEIYEITGRPLSGFHSDGRGGSLPNPIVKLIIAPGEGMRQKLKQDIADRFMRMLEAGLVEEVRGLYERGDLTPELPAMRLVGYRQVWQYLDGHMNYNDMINKAITATRQLAKRQLTWFRLEQNVRWLDAADPKLSHFLLNLLAENPVISS